MNRFLRICLTGCLVITITGNAAGQAKRDAAKEAAILDQLRKVAPGSVEDFQQGTAAMDSEDYAYAVESYEKVLKKAPEFDPALRRLGISLAESGRIGEGRDFLEKAVKKNRSPENLISLAQVLAYPGHDTIGSKEDKEQALMMVREASLKVTDDDPSYPLLQAQLALDLDRLNEFRAAAGALSQKHPDLMQAHYFNAILAATDEKWSQAEDEIKTAGRLGLPPEVVQSFLDSGVRSHANTWRYAYYALYLVTAWISGLILLFLLGRVMSSLTLRSIEADEPNDPDHRRHRVLRNAYRRLITVAGIYYYISIPFVIVIVLGVAGSATYASIGSGHILNIKLLGVLVIGSLVTTYMMIHSLFIGRDREEPGRSLDLNEAPGLWGLAREVASRIQTRPVDEIRITPGTDLAVYERGSTKERAQDKGRRILLLGIANLNGLSQNAFRAVLAHEYGHLSHRDTAGGDVALRVNANMRTFAINIIRAGQAAWWNLGFHFVRIYHFIFRRLSHGATRLQEVLADRAAVMNYGAKAFEEGLRHVIRRSIEFEDIAYWEANEANKMRRPLQNLYDLEPRNLASVEEKYERAMARPTTADDTHPGPMDRFRYAARIATASVDERPGMMWDLFPDRQLLTKEMNEVISRLV
jgi:Zn-dependent protease with chaperone function